MEICGFVGADNDVSPDIQLDNINVDVANLNALVTRALQSDESNLDPRELEIRELLYQAAEIERRLGD